MGDAVSPIDILLVEDNPDDVEITKMSLEQGRVPVNLTVARDGQEALDMLYGQSGNAPLPGLILLDLHIPKISGMEVLEKIKTDPKLRSIPVIVLTISTRDQDVLRSYDLGGNTFISKPVEFDEFVGVVNTIEDYWLDVCTLPKLGKA